MLQRLKKNILLYFIALIFVTFIIFEGTIAFMYHFPSYAVGPFKNFIYNVYLLIFRDIIQYDKECARYDSELTYTLLPGRCNFSNVEFSNDFYINSLGLRDDEDSLRSPDIVVAGDSLAMGWGVDQDETFAQILEEETGLKVLNAAISSYGTVREIRILNRLDISGVKYLVIQYGKNDLFENMFYSFGHDSLDIMSREKYETTIWDHARWRRYYPGKYAVLFLKGLMNGIAFEKYDFIKAADLSGVPIESEVKFFLNALLKEARFSLKEVNIIILGAEDFLASLKEEVKSGDYADYIKEIRAVSYLNKIDDSCTYQIDEHLNAKGHRIIADEVLKVITQ